METEHETDTGVPDGTEDETTALRRALREAPRKLWDASPDGTVAARLRELADWAATTPHADTPLDVYGDGVVAEVEDRVARALGFPAAAFFPTGTMAQQVALRCWAGRTGNPVVALHPLAHPEVHEDQAFTTVGGLRTTHPTTAPRLPTADEVRDHPEPFGALMLELPLRDAGFVLPTWDELVDVVEAARERDAVVHFDGARLWETPTRFGRELPEIAGLADSVYVSFYKSLGGMSGAAVAGPEDLIDEARLWRHRYGGDVFQQYPAAMSALRGLETELPRLPSYVAHARMAATVLREVFEEAGVGWFRVHPEPPHTHQFQVWLPYAPEALTAASLALAQEGTALFRRWFPGPAGGPPGTAMTEVTISAPGLEWTADDVRAAARAFLGKLDR
ncbi:MULTISPECIES: beta-eliminating lyase-related protein [unclassified Streptomyces]|uniref:threonine aldolase family protein n=1 Tax=unclassified Streptomyces TaxID=2593676 RepID=UPI002E32734F|nr:beta-eliminating lyase-related protein [Streptomyces sp. NBC_01268]